MIFITVFLQLLNFLKKRLILQLLTQFDCSQSTGFLQIIYTDKFYSPLEPEIQN